MNIRPTARVVVLNKDNKILLLKIKSENTHCWLTPGGKIEGSETAFEAAKRELFEETGITNAKFFGDSHVWYYERIGTCNGEPTFFKEHIFLAYVQETNIHFDNLMDYERDEIFGFVWWDIAEFIQKKEKLFPETLADDIQNFIEQKPGLTREQIEEI